MINGCASHLVVTQFNLIKIVMAAYILLWKTETQIGADLNQKATPYRCFLTALTPCALAKASHQPGASSSLSVGGNQRILTKAAHRAEGARVLGALAVGLRHWAKLVGSVLPRYLIGFLINFPPVSDDIKAQFIAQATRWVLERYKKTRHPIFYYYSINSALRNSTRGIRPPAVF